MAKEPEVHDPYVTLFKLVLSPWHVHFRSPGYIKDSTMELLDTNVCKKVLEMTTKSAEVRRALGISRTIWHSLTLLFMRAIPSLEKRSFAAASATISEHEGASGTLIAHQSHSLLKDLERLNDLVSIARNILTIGDVAQNLAAKCLFDQEVFNLMNVCVKVTARGFDGDAGTTDEEKWQLVINAYKKQLITCLHFVNNLIVQNERRKLMLWVELFDSSADGPLIHGSIDNETGKDITTQSDENPESSVTQLAVELQQSMQGPYQPSANRTDGNGGMGSPSSPLDIFLVGMRSNVKEELGANATSADIAAECNRKWQDMPDDEKKTWHALFMEVNSKLREEGIPKGREQSAVIEDALARLNLHDISVSFDKNRTDAAASEVDTIKAKASLLLKDIHHYIPVGSGLSYPPPVKETDFGMTHTAAEGAIELQKGKDSLMKHINLCDRPTAAEKASFPRSDPRSPQSPRPHTVSTENTPNDGDGTESEDESDDEDYVIAGDEGRGLLTDVPLILGPSEVEVLPMIIMSGIVPSPTSCPVGKGIDAEEVRAIINMHAVRCHLLLAQDHGRNLLRELLIFIAAWDLREEELYFKFMMKIIEAILTNGLMPFAYHAFRESKDIISPAQAVIMKILTNIYRSRQTSSPPQNLDLGTATINANTPKYPWRVDVHMVNYLLTQFRQHIIPQTCALIFLQGQIAAGHAQADEFPLNLWDMERMYEGIYQYLEFFAILTEHEAWKRMMTEWEIVSELVTLLKELNIAIPKGRLVPPTGPQDRPLHGASVTQSVVSHSDAVPVSVERPYELGSAEAGVLPADQAQPALPEQAPYPEDQQDEPSEFEWRNLKKLAVLVLSSLIWKSREVQDQVRKFGGIEAILCCCSYDEHNPYIREHAIMCLRFLMEGNRDNQEVIRQLEAREVVPSEVLDQHGYETFMDSKGQVGLRRKETSKYGTMMQAWLQP